MCGINGIISKEKNKDKLIKEMNNRIIHRGPDAEGIYVDDITLKDMCYAKAVRAKYPRARVLKIDKVEAESDERCVKVITAEDVP